tara:strand:+ start:722 stop:1003 length:282 start_codon:yes stop_codon:yes gene_type:complete
VTPRFKKGDLAELNKFGRIMLYPSHKDLVKVGLVMTDPYDIFYPDEFSENYLEYWGYDIMFGDQLITMIPEEFIIKPGEKDETDTDEVEDLFK